MCSGILESQKRNTAEKKILKLQFQNGIDSSDIIKGKDNILTIFTFKICACPSPLKLDHILIGSGGFKQGEETIF